MQHTIILRDGNDLPVVLDDRLGEPTVHYLPTRDAALLFLVRHLGGEAYGEDPYNPGYLVARYATRCTVVCDGHDVTDGLLEDVARWQNEEA